MGRPARTPAFNIINLTRLLAVQHLSLSGQRPGRIRAENRFRQHHSRGHRLRRFQRRRQARRGFTQLAPVQLVVMLGDGTGGFGPPQGFGLTGQSRSIAIGDLNRDGKLDIVTTEGRRTASRLPAARLPSLRASPRPTPAAARAALWSPPERRAPGSLRVK